MNDTPMTPPQTGSVQPVDVDSIPDVLERICARTRVDVAQRAKVMPLKEITARAREVNTPPRGFGQALKQKTADHQIGLIAEIKKASPSAGILRPDYEPTVIAEAYEAAGAACISVLTEGSCFHGSAEDLTRVREACKLPILRKDFIIDPWQVHESRLMGADCILLIMAILTDAEAAELLDIARGLDMDVLVEVHDEGELNRALALDTSLIGINNRNLKTLQTDIETTCRLAPLVPPDRIIVSESGIRTHADVMKLNAIGASGFLVGESLLRHEDVGAAVHALLGTTAPASPDAGEGIEITARVRTTGPTGVEMEALTAASVAALTLYDMCKAVERDMEIGQIHVIHKSGGASGTYDRASGS